MNIERFRKLKENRYKIIFDNENSITLYDDIILKYDLLITKKISEKKLRKLIEENNSLECYYKAIKYLSYKNRSKKEIINYLKKFSYEYNNINKTIKKLEENNYLNEEIYLSSYINDQLNLTNNGPQKIKRKLIDLGLQEDLIDKKLSQISRNVWQEKLEKIISKKIKVNQKDSVNKIKEKILYNCLNDGYKKDDILEVLEKKEIPNNILSLEKEAQKLYIKLSRKYQNNNELYFQLKGKLLRKGFFNTDIDEIIENIKKVSN